jgi:hypothetical protein
VLDGVRVIASPVAGIEMFPAASLRETLKRDPFSIVAVSTAAVELIAVIAIVLIPLATLIVNVWKDSLPDRAAKPEVEDSFHTTSV